MEKIYKAIWLTNGTGKMNDIVSINTSSLTNSFCNAKSKDCNSICSKCYSTRYTKMRPTLERRLIENSELLSSNIIKKSELPKLNASFVRFNSFGELINELHFKNLINICKTNKRTLCVLWTKRIEILDSVLGTIEKPKNLVIIISNNYINAIMDKLPQYADKSFNVVTKDYIESSGIITNCDKSCNECRLCYSRNNITTIIEKIK